MKKKPTDIVLYKSKDGTIKLNGQMRIKFCDSAVFGREKDKSLHSSLNPKERQKAATELINRSALRANIARGLVQYLD